MQVRFEPSGVQIHRGLLLARADVYIDDPTSKTYAQQYIQVATEAIPKECFDKDGRTIRTVYDAWWKDIPKIWQLNPALCHMFVITESAKLEDISAYLKEKVFTPDNIATLDNYLALPDAIHYVSPFMRRIPRLTDTAVKTTDLVDLIATTKVLLANKVIDLSAGGKIIEVAPESIDMGAGAVLTGDGISIADRTYVVNDNPANATGTIDTFEIYLSTSSNEVIAATIASSVPSYTTNDSETCGALTSGAKRTVTGLTIAVTLGDNLGFWSAGGAIWYSAGVYVGSVAGEYIHPTDNFIPTANYPGYTISIYATGTETGGGSCASVVSQHMARMRRN